jgi:hypothetical protein
MILALISGYLVCISSFNLISTMEIQSNLDSIQSAFDTTCGEGIAIVDETGYVDDWVCICPTPTAPQ